MRALEDPDASGMRYVVTGTKNAGAVVFDFRTTEPATVRIWCRVRAPSSDRDSFSVGIDGGPLQTVFFLEHAWSGEWQWAPLVPGERDGTAPYDLQPTPIPLGAGRHRLVFKGREVGTGLDRILLTTDPGPDSPPLVSDPVPAGQPAP
jgi:hypothetical protein